MNKALLTIKQFVDKNIEINRWPNTEANVRSLYRRKEVHQLEDAFVKIGGRILVDEERFYNRGP